MSEYQMTFSVQVKRLELLLSKYNETIRVDKEKVRQLTADLETTEKQLRLRLKEFESLQVTVWLAQLAVCVVCDAHQLNVKCRMHADLERAIANDKQAAYRLQLTAACIFKWSGTSWTYILSFHINVLW